MDSQQDLPGAQPISASQTRFTVWAPVAKTVSIDIVVRDQDTEFTVRTHLLTRGKNGLFADTISACPAGTLYRIRRDQSAARPDPRSQFQPFGVHGPSEVIDHRSFQWTDDLWRGVRKQDLVIYELHVGSFSMGGTLDAAIPLLPELVELGVTAIELMPVAQCPGRWNWGYDGVNLFAPSNNFGRPNDFKRLIDRCHQLGLAVILDVVFNHLGPEGNYLGDLGPYTSKKFRTPWGESLDFQQRAVRDFVIDNVLQWLRDYHVDGLRLDAVHYLFDDGNPHIVTEMLQVFREFEAIAGRPLHFIAESNIFDSRLVGNNDDRQSDCDAIWADCLMHSIYKIGVPALQLTDRQYRATDLPSVLARGYMFQAPDARRMPDLPPQHDQPELDHHVLQSLIVGIQTHDSVGNHPEGARLHQLTSLDFQKAAAALAFLYPAIPILFMGEEFAAGSKFPFFADFEDSRLRTAVDRGRHAEFPDHDWSSSLLPSDPEAFLASQLDRRQGNKEMRDWYTELLRLRRLGIRNGWLRPEFFSTSAEIDSCIFRISYTGTFGEVHVCCCLALELIEPMSFSQLGVADLLLNSRPGTGALGAQQAVVWTSDAAKKRSHN